MAQGQRIEGTEITRTHNRRSRLGAADACRLLRAPRLEGMAAMGVPSGGDRNELDCRLRDELDHGEFLPQRYRTPFWMGVVAFDGTDLPASTSRFCSDLDLLAHPVLDVPPQDLLKNLSNCSRHAVSNGPHP